MHCTGRAAVQTKVAALLLLAVAGGLLLLAVCPESFQAGDGAAKATALSSLKPHQPLPSLPVCFPGSSPFLSAALSASCRALQSIFQLGSTCRHADVHGWALRSPRTPVDVLASPRRRYSICSARRDAPAETCALSADVQK